MSKLIALLFILGLVGCSTHQSGESTSVTSDITREVASVKSDLKDLQATIEKTRKIFPKLGNPRYYIFDHFVNRGREVVAGKFQGQKLNEELLKLVSAHKVMSEAGIYLNFSKIVDADSKEVTAGLTEMDRLVNQIRDQVENKFFVEDKEKAETSERLSLVKALSERIGRYYKGFVKGDADKASIKTMLGVIKGLNADNAEFGYAQLKKNKGYKQARKILKNLNLPDSGEIDGASDAFEKVMSVQVSMEMISVLVERELRN